MQALKLVFAGAGCSPVPSSSIPKEAFALFSTRGVCPFDDKMSTAVAAGATTLIVAETLETEYNTSGAATPHTLSLFDPCGVSCDAGRGVVDTSTLDVPSVLAGLPGRCPTAEPNHRGCTSGLCAFAGPPNEISHELSLIHI